MGERSWYDAHAMGPSDMRASRCGRSSGSRRRAFSWLVVLFAMTACRPRADRDGHVYVSNEQAGTVSVIDARTRTVVATIRVGKRPRGIRISPDGHRAYVALSGSPNAPPGTDPSTLPRPDPHADGIGVIDLASRRLLRVLPSGPDPESFDVTPDGRSIYVSNEDSATVSVLDLASGGIVATIAVGAEPEGVAVRPDGRFVYVTCESAHAIDVIEVATRTVVTTLETGLRPRGIAFTPDGTRAFVTSELSGSVDVFDSVHHRALGSVAIASVPGAHVAPRPMGLRVAPDGSTLFVSNGRAGTVSFIDVRSLRVTATLAAVGARPWGLDVSADGRTVYVANGPWDDVVVLDVATRRIVQRIAVDVGPWGLAVGP